MLIGEALSEKKNLQSKLANLYNLMRSCYSYTSEEPNFDFNKLRKEAEDTVVELRKLKKRIQETNLSTFVEHNGIKRTLTSLILELGDIRSEIATLNCLEFDRDPIFRRGIGEPVEQKFQVPPEDIQKDIKELNKQKNIIDSILQKTNWTVELI